MNFTTKNAKGAKGIPSEEGFGRLSSLAPYGPGFVSFASFVVISAL